uniref:ORF26 n=1 Tax=Nitrosopumilaceae spindle-shaped virus TaxID=3065433 RepID=A0AAT9J963_9VIRU
MRCKTCKKVVKAGTANKKHCWISNQRCGECHYIGGSKFIHKRGWAKVISQKVV